MSSSKQGKTPSNSPITCADDDHPLLEVGDGAVDQVAETPLALPALEAPTLPDLQLLADTAVSAAEAVLYTPSDPVRIPRALREQPGGPPTLGLPVTASDHEYNRAARDMRAMPPPAEVVNADEPVSSKSSQLRRGIAPAHCRKRSLPVEVRREFFTRRLGMMGRCGCTYEFDAIFDTDYDRARAVRDARRWCDKLDADEEDLGYVTLYDPTYKKGPPIKHISLDPSGDDDDWETDAMHPIELQKTN